MAEFLLYLLCAIGGGLFGLGMFLLVRHGIKGSGDEQGPEGD